LFYFSQQNHVTFRDDTVVIQSNNIDLSSSSSSSSKRISITGGNISNNSILHNATSIHLHLCNAMKALLLISPTALVQFLPLTPLSAIDLRIYAQLNGFLFCPTNSPQMPNTLAMLVSELNAQIPNDNCYYPIKSTNDTAYLDSAVDSNIPSGERVKHNLLKTYVEFVFNPDHLLTTCINHYLNENQQINNDPRKEEKEGIQLNELIHHKRLNRSPPPPSSSPSITTTTRSNKLSISQLTIHQYFPLSSLHHSIIRGLILLLSDIHCPNNILIHLFNNIWLLLTLIIKSMTQYLCISKKIW
uniref:Mlh1_C domain-containing protein n=1 Tax=Schistosoma curassoni TaxID=6186 RepID=A0A183KPQ6_9TREM